jgi:hypothetical protein
MHTFGIRSGVRAMLRRHIPMRTANAPKKAIFGEFPLQTMGLA